MIELPWIDPEADTCRFPPVERALHEPNGLLAFGGRLDPDCLLTAYRHGIFPWYNEGEPILWWSPDPRTVLYPEAFRVTRSLRKTLRRVEFTITLDSAFDRVIAACAEPRPRQAGTWINHEMAAAYRELHRLGHAHSVEAWREGELVGGLYGIAIGWVFFGESMFSRVSDASKVATYYLTRQLLAWGFRLIDCQVYSGHLASLGACEIERARFVEALNAWCPHPDRPAPWRLEIPLAVELKP